MTETVGDFLARTLRESGAIAAGQVPVQQDISDCLLRANTMLAQWQRKRWLVYHLIDVAAPSTGVAAYTVGPGQQFNVGNRPERIYAGYFRQYPNSGIATKTYQVCVRDRNNPSIISNILPLTVTIPQTNSVDYPLHVIPARENYSQIALKNLSSWPESVFLDTGWPYGTAYFYPVPLAGQFELHLLFAEVLATFPNLTSPINFPPEYEAGIFYNLIVRTRAAYGMMQDNVMIALAKDGLGTIREANLQIPNMRMPPQLVRDGRYNIYSDNTDR